MGFLWGIKKVIDVQYIAQYFKQSNVTPNHSYSLYTEYYIHIVSGLHITPNLSRDVKHPVYFPLILQLP